MGTLADGNNEGHDGSNSPFVVRLVGMHRRESGASEFGTTVLAGAAVYY